VAASRMQIVPVWPPVAGNMNNIEGNLHATGGTQVQFACDLRPPSYKTRDKQTRGV
jgi:hypothetical protein